MKTIADMISVVLISNINQNMANIRYIDTTPYQFGFFVEVEYNKINGVY